VNERWKEDLYSSKDSTKFSENNKQKVSTQINILIALLTNRFLDGSAPMDPNVRLERAPAAARLADDTERAAEAKVVVRSPAVVKEYITTETAGTVSTSQWTTVPVSVKAITFNNHLKQSGVC
jgi:hypothetical protein